MEDLEMRSLAVEALNTLDPSALSSEPSLLWVPGRIEIVGKHVDYAKGSSLVCAVDRGLLFAYRRTTDKIVTITSCDYNSLPLRYDLNDWKGAVELPENKEGWALYITSIVTYLMTNDCEVSGFSIAVKSSLPQNSGLSSSSALVCGISSILSPIALSIDTLGKIESMDLVGTRGGSQDHAAIMESKEGQLCLFSYVNGTKLEKRIEMPKNWVFVIAVSGVSACKTGNALEKYNKLAGSSEEEKLARAKKETEKVVPMACTGFERSDENFLAKAILLSQKHAETELQTTVEETEWLPQEALRLGAIGSTTFGAGFGGACYAIIEKSKLESSNFMENWQTSYRKRFPDPGARSKFFVTTPSKGATFL